MSLQGNHGDGVRVGANLLDAHRRSLLRAATVPSRSTLICAERVLSRETSAFVSHREGFATAVRLLRTKFIDAVESCAQRGRMYVPGEPS